MSEKVRKVSASDRSPVRIGLLIGKFVESEGRVREEARRNLVKIGDPAIEPLIKALSNTNPQVRWEAAKTLGEIGNPVASPALVEAMQDLVFDVRWVAAESLINIGPASLIPLLQFIMAKANDVWFMKGAHHVVNHFAGGDLKIDHHIIDHPWLKEFEFQEQLRRLVKAMEGPEPPVEAPVAAQLALEKIRSARKG